MTREQFEEMIEDQAALRAYDVAEYNKAAATAAGFGDPDMAISFVPCTTTTTRRTYALQNESFEFEF